MNSGAQKAGTTSLAYYLKQHGACFSDPTAENSQGDGKESHFFDNWRLYHRGGLDYYRYVFRHCANATLRVDGTPEFMKTAERIYETYQRDSDAIENLKIIVSLREPVSRDISWYHHRLRDCRTEPYAASVCDHQQNAIAFEQVMRKEVVWRLERNETKNVYGTYVNYLRLFFELFARRQILVLSYEEAKTSPQRYLQRVHDFLGLEGPATELPRRNTDHGTYDMPSCVTQRALGRRYEPYNQELYQLLAQYPGPEEEQTPFPDFRNPCFEETVNETESDPFVYVPPPSKHNVPNVFVAGAQDSLTASIARDLQGCLPVRGDKPEHFTHASHFFDKSYAYKKGRDYYEAFFEHCEVNSTIVDATADMIMYPKRVYEMMRSEPIPPKFIFVLRDPVLRELSLYDEHSKDCSVKSKYCNNGKPLSFQDVVERHVVSKLKANKLDNVRGLYSRNLKVWFDLWERDSILVLNAEDTLDRNSNRIRSFLNLGPGFSLNSLPHVQVGNRKSELKALHEAVSTFNNELYDILGKIPLRLEGTFLQFASY